MHKVHVAGAQPIESHGSCSLCREADVRRDGDRDVGQPVDAGVTGLDFFDALPAPATFLAFTVTVYFLPFFSLVMVQVFFVAFTVQVRPPGFAVAV